MSWSVIGLVLMSTVYESLGWKGPWDDSKWNEYNPWGWMTPFGHSHHHHHNHGYIKPFPYSSSEEPSSPYISTRYPGVYGPPPHRSQYPNQPSGPYQPSFPAIGTGAIPSNPNSPGFPISGVGSSPPIGPNAIPNIGPFQEPQRPPSSGSLKIPPTPPPIPDPPGMNGPGGGRPSGGNSGEDLSFPPVDLGSNPRGPPGSKR